MTDVTKTPDPNRDDVALDQLLRQAKPARDGAREADLLERIMAAAETTPRLVAVATAPRTAATIIPLTARRPDRDLWRAAGILAASLVVGVFLGQSPFGEQTVRRIEQSTGFVLASASHEAAISLAAAELDEDD